MPLGIVSDSELNTELNNCNLPVNLPSNIPVPRNRVPSNQNTPTIVDIPTPGRSEGDKNVPESLRKLIGETSAIEGHNAGVELGKQFGISASSVSAYQNGAHSTASYDKPNESLKNHVTDARTRVATKARKRLMMALNAITEEKLENIKVTDASAIAKDMSAIVKNMEKDDGDNSKSQKNTTFVFYNPGKSNEVDYPVIHVRE